MKITKTGIPDIVKENIDQSKVELSEKIIENIYPLFDDIFNDKVSQVKRLEKELIEKKKLILGNKSRLESMIIDKSKKKKVMKLIDRIDKLVSSGLLEGSAKKENIILLKMVDRLDDEKLNFHLKNTMKIITSKYGGL